MKETTTPKSTPSPPAPAEPSKATPKSTSTVFITMALDMTWRLAIVVLVPVIGGFKLDEELDKSPLFTITGFVVAMAGMTFVLWQTLQKANQIQSKEEKHK